jgi:hypothetical protein
MDVATSNSEWKIASPRDPPSLLVPGAAPNTVAAEFSEPVIANEFIVGMSPPTAISRRSIKGPIQ